MDTPPYSPPSSPSDPASTGSPNAGTPPAASSRGLLVVVWLIVTVPALWGVGKTVQTSLNLFRPPAAAATQSATAPAASH